MKIRSGFVSNSSSASFVVMGYKLQVPRGHSTVIWLFEKLFPKPFLDELALKYFKKLWDECDEEEKQECGYDYKWDNRNDVYMMLNSDDGLEDESQPVIGIRIADVSDYDSFEYSEVSFGHMLSELWKLKEKFNIDENNEPALFLGTRAN